MIPTKDQQELTLPLSAGAKKEGAAGFFKGIGKGLVGVVARPTGGIVDMASSTFQGIQRYLLQHGTFICFQYLGELVLCELPKCWLSPLFFLSAH